MPSPAAPTSTADRFAALVDYDGLADFLGTLTHPLRLELLDLLRQPRALDDLPLGPRPGPPWTGAPARPPQREVDGHLAQLVDADLVRAERDEEGAGGAVRYAANRAKLYALTEELRRLGALPAGPSPGDPRAAPAEGAPGADEARGPRLVLVHGVYEGRAYLLTAERGGEPRWLIGRRRGLAVCLDYDPYVSLENAMVTRRGRAYVLTDLPGSRNGTSVNWTPIPKGGSRALRPGDVVSVGRSRLCFAL